MRTGKKMTCNHDLTEREVAVAADGYCPLCQATELTRLQQSNAELVEALKTIVANTESDAIPHRDYADLAKAICECATAVLSSRT